MVMAVVGADALNQRRLVKSSGTGEVHWRTDFIGQRGNGELKDAPQAFLIDMSANEVIVPHFHEVDQFQVFVAGGGSLGRTADLTNPVAVHYADHHTGYGPITAGPTGFSYFTLRAKTDPGAVYLHRPGYREKLKPSAKRHGVAPAIVLSTEPVLKNRTEISIEELLPNLAGEDAPGAQLIRMGSEASMTGTDPRHSGGQHWLILNGSLELSGRSYTAWSTIFVAAEDAPLAVRSGARGLEAIVLRFPRHESIS